MRSIKTGVFSSLLVLLLIGCTWVAPTESPGAASREEANDTLQTDVDADEKKIFDHQENDKQMITTKFLSATIHVFDMDKSLSFFNGLIGLPVLQRVTIEDADAGDADVALLGVQGQPFLSLIARSSYAAIKHQGFSVAIETVSLDETLRKLKEAGYPILRGPFSPQPGSRLCFVEGPEGIEVELVENAPR